MPTINKPKKQTSINYNKNERKKFYNSKQWFLIRSEKLRTDPLCEICLNDECNQHITPATQVHHQRSFMDGKNDVEKWQIFLDYKNLLSICDVCHGKIHSRQQHNNN